MARALRIQFENAHYHVTCRGNARQNIFTDKHDYHSFLELLERSSEIYQTQILAYVLMQNHFHMLLRTPLANLQEFMRHFNISYTSRYNRSHHRSGHLYQGRYKSFVIDADSYLLAASRYVHLNPVRVRSAEDLPLEEKRKRLNSYPWTSYTGYIYPEKSMPFVHYDILQAFGSDDAEARANYARFVEAGLQKELENPFDKGKNHGVVGDETFMQNVNRLVPTIYQPREIPAVRHIRKVEVESILGMVETHTKSKRKEFLGKGCRGWIRPLLMELLYRYAGLNQRQIGELMHVDYSTVSVCRKRFSSTLEAEPVVKQLFAAIKSELEIPGVTP